MTDNKIFKELKILLDYKDQEIKKAQLEATSGNSRIQNYMLSIKKLQDENERLKNEQNALGKSAITFYPIVFLLLLFMALSYIYYKKFKKASEDRFS